MNSIQELIYLETQRALELKAARTKHLAALQALHDPLQALYDKYREAFGGFQDSHLELCEGLVPSDGINTVTTYWGNAGLSSIFHDMDGFTVIETADSFRGCASSYEVKIPTKYLVEGGEVHMLLDIERIEAQIAEIERKKDVLADQAEEEKDRSEFARLSKKFNSATSS